jgi:MFS family permease
MMNLHQSSDLLSKAPADSAKPPPASQVRYRVLGLSLLMAFMMYMERGAIGAAAPTIMREFHVNKISMGWALSAFNWSYALFQVPAGWMAGRFGPRIVLAAAMAWWSVFTAATGLTLSTSSLAATRFLFGIGEAAAFPAGSRALVRWLPVRRRAFGQGFQHSGSRLGAALAPALVVTMIAWSGWRPVFYIFGVVGIVWAMIWYAYYRDLPLRWRASLAHAAQNACGFAKLLVAHYKEHGCGGSPHFPSLFSAGRGWPMLVVARWGEQLIFSHFLCCP